MGRFSLFVAVCVAIAATLSATARAAVPGGTFVTVITENPDNLNPYLHGLLASGSVYRYVFDSPFTWYMKASPPAVTGT